MYASPAANIANRGANLMLGCLILMLVTLYFMVYPLQTINNYKHWLDVVVLCEFIIEITSQTFAGLTFRLCNLLHLRSTMYSNTSYVAKER